MLRGNALAKVDEKGRLKLPSAYRSVIEPNWGGEFFVTSLRGESVLMFPMSVYSDIESRLFGPDTGLAPAVLRRVRNTINYYGQTAGMDSQGRVLIHPLLRSSARMDGEVTVLGRMDHLEIWHREVFEERLRGDPLTDDDLALLAPFGL